MNNFPENMSPETIAAFLSQQLSNEEAMLVQNWIEQSPENRQVFEHYKTVWQWTGEIIPTPVDVNVELAWSKMSNDIDKWEKNEIEITKTPKIKTFERKYLLRIAAVFIPLFAIASLYFILSKKPATISKQTLAQTLLYTLPDSSTVCLNKNSKLFFPESFDSKTREVKMEGEIFFSIKSNKEKPFIIQTDNTLIEVIGTSFNVQSFADSSAITVLVKTGKVKFSCNKTNLTDSSSIFLTVGEKGIYDKKTRQLSRVYIQEYENEMYWQSKTLVFNKTKLKSVVETLQKKFGVKIVLKDENLNNLRFTTTFSNQNIDAILSVIASTFELKMSKEGEIFFLNKNEQ